MFNVQCEVFATRILTFFYLLLLPTVAQDAATREGLNVVLRIVELTWASAQETALAVCVEQLERVGVLLQEAATGGGAGSAAAQQTHQVRVESYLNIQNIQCKLTFLMFQNCTSNVFVC